MCSHPWQGALEALVRSLGNVSALSILAMGGALVAAGELSVGRLTSFVIYSLYISTAFGTLATAYADLQRAAGSGSRIFDILRSQPEPTGTPGGLV